jgi:integrase
VARRAADSGKPTLALTEGDLDHRRGSLLVRRGKGGRRPEVGMDAWAGNNFSPGSSRVVGPLLCVINGTTRGRHWSPAAARAELRRTAAAAGVRRRFAPHQLRHAHAIEMAREGIPLIVIQRQLGHSNLGITSVYLQGIDSGDIIERAAPGWPKELRALPLPKRTCARYPRRPKVHGGTVRFPLTRT